MYTLDLQYYYDNQIIGNQYEEIPKCDPRWQEMADIAYDKLQDYITVLTNWYTLSTLCLGEGDCKDTIESKWSVIQSDISDLTTKYSMFWDMMIDDCSSYFDNQVFQNYLDAQDTLLCDVEELKYLVDGIVI